MALRFGGETAVRRSRPGGRSIGGRPPNPTDLLRRPVRATPRSSVSACPELDCVSHLIPRDTITAAERRAQRVGIGAERVLICAGVLTEEAYVTALAASLGTVYQPLDRLARNNCPLSDRDLIGASAAGLLPLRDRGGRLVWIIAPLGLTARRLADPHLRPPKWLVPFRLTTSKELQRFVARHTHRALGKLATHELQRSRPLFSNAPRKKGWRSGVAIAGVVAADIFVCSQTSLAVGLFGAFLCVIFLLTAALRLLSIFLTDKEPEQLPRVDDRELPIYSIVCALYGEAAVVADLVSAIRDLDYPPEKLDVKFVIEPDDDETRQALANLKLGAPFEIVTAPAIGPRTKPKALNVALPLVRGTYTVVYDAEDKPEPEQLRRAVAMFLKGDRKLACLQAPLTIDNTADNWLTGGIMAQTPQELNPLCT